MDWFYPCISKLAMTTDATGLSNISPPALSGTASQVEWANRIKLQVDAEFNRVAASFRSVSNKQTGGKRADTECIIAILEAKRADVMSRNQAGYFIRDWREISDQVRQMIFLDARYQAIKSNRMTPKTTLGRLAAL